MNDIEKAIADLQEYIGSGEYNGSNPPIYLKTAQIAIEALEMQTELQNLINDIKKDYKPNDRYSVRLVLEMLESVRSVENGKE